MPLVIKAELFGLVTAVVLHAALHMATTIQRRRASGLPKQAPASGHDSVPVRRSPGVPVMIAVVASISQLVSLGLLVAAALLGLNRFGWIIVAIRAPFGSLRGELLAWIFSGALGAGLLLSAGIRGFESGARLHLRRDAAAAISRSAAWPLLGGSAGCVLLAGVVQIIEGPPSFDAYFGYVAPPLLVLAALLRWAEREAGERLRAD